MSHLEWIRCQSHVRNVFLKDAYLLIKEEPFPHMFYMRKIFSILFSNVEYLTGYGLYVCNV
jgi:hypothetical protein